MTDWTIRPAFYDDLFFFLRAVSVLEPPTPWHQVERKIWRPAQLPRDSRRVPSSPKITLLLFLAREDWPEEATWPGLLSFLETFEREVKNGEICV